MSRLVEYIIRVPAKSRLSQLKEQVLDLEVATWIHDNDVSARMPPDPLSVIREGPSGCSYPLVFHTVDVQGTA